MVGDGELDGVAQCGGCGERFVGALSFQHATLRRFFDRLAGVQRRHVERAALRHHLRRFFIHERAVFDRCHTRPNGELDSLGAVRVCGDAAVEFVRFVDERLQLFE